MDAPILEQILWSLNEINKKLENIQSNSVSKEQFNNLTNQLNDFVQQVTEVQNTHAEAIQANTNRIATISTVQNLCNINKTKSMND
jgi:Asp-tRNA(Asn)/Glu-tRNA(Gln) amidotransferase C subunit